MAKVSGSCSQIGQFILCSRARQNHKQQQRPGCQQRAATPHLGTRKHILAIDGEVGDACDPMCPLPNLLQDLQQAYTKTQSGFELNQTMTPMSSLDRRYTRGLADRSHLRLTSLFQPSSGSPECQVSPPDLLRETLVPSEPTRSPHMSSEPKNLLWERYMQI